MNVMNVDEADLCHHYTSSVLRCRIVTEIRVRFDVVCYHLNHSAYLREGQSVEKSVVLSLTSSHAQRLGHRYGFNTALPPRPHRSALVSSNAVTIRSL